MKIRVKPRFRNGKSAFPSRPPTLLRRFASLFFCLLLTGVFLLSSPSPVRGAEQVVRVGWYDSSFNTMDAAGRRSGYAYEYQMKIAAYTGWRYEYVTGSWPELLDMLISGELDLMSDVSYTADRAEKMLFPSLPMGEEEYYLFISRDNREISALDYSTLNGKKIGVNKGSVQAGYYREWAALHGVECELVEVTCSEAESVRMLSSGDLDGYVTVDAFSNQERPMPVCRIGASDFFFAVSKARPDLLSELETALNRIQEEDGDYNQLLFEKHLVTSGSNAFLTANEKSWLESHGTIRIGYQDQYLAFCAADPATGELTGALKDYLESASDCIVNAHFDFEAKAYPTAAAAVEALKAGEVDCVFPANLTPGDGESMGLFMTPPLMRTDVFAVVRQNDRSLFSSRDHVIVAVNEGNPNYESFLMDTYPDWQIVYYPTSADCLKAISQGVADCLLISSYRYNNIARSCERLNLTTVTTAAMLDYCFAVAAGQPELYSILAKIADLVPDATVNTALSRYVAEDAKSTLGDLLSQHIWLVLSVSAAILLVILVLMLRNMRAVKKSRELIAATETDDLTGLYNRDYFLEYAGRMGREHPETPYDAIVLNIDRFHSVNALNGREFGDRVLRALGSEVRAVAEENGGIAGRFGADRFDIFCRHLDDCHGMYARLQETLNAQAPSADIRLRAGVMPSQTRQEPVQMFDRARVACSMAKQHYGEELVVFDDRMLERENYEQRLLADLHRALAAYEFEVYYQPQYDIRSDPPVPVSAEALVRWNHPVLGMIAPNDFIPLFERSGKIGQVDRYVWAESVRQVARWRDMYGITFPVSVNLSRVDVFDPELESTLDRTLEYHGLSRESLRLEVTESAWTGNADQVIRVVSSLRSKGYEVEMDDFGSGYSSLNMLSAMPVDVLKMDRAFIRNLADHEKDAQLVALILGLAKNLNIPVVAEGVETVEQLALLRNLGCEFVQGFYFSRPLPPDEFEAKVIRVAAGTADSRKP